MRSLLFAAVLAMTMGFLAPAEELGGIPTAWTGDYVYLIYELIQDPPPDFATRYRMTFSIEFSTRPDGTHQARIELEGAFPAGPPGVGLDRALSLMLYSPMMGLWSAYLDMVEPPLVPGETYELRPPAHYADMPPELAVPMPQGRLEIGEEELEVADVIAVEATLIAVDELHGEETEIAVRLALPKDPILPYPVWVRPPADDPSAAWVSEVKLIAFRLQPPPPTITVQPGESIQAAIDAAPEGAVIELEEGSWEENLTIDKSLTLRAAEIEPEPRAVIRSTRVGWPVIRIASDEPIEVTVSGLKIAGAFGVCYQWEPDRICADGISVHGKATATIENNMIRGNERYGIGMLDKSEVSIENNIISDNGRDGIGMGHSAQTTIANNTISDNSSGIMMWSSSQATIAVNTIADNENLGIGMLESSQATIENNTISENWFGIVMCDPSHAMIANNTISDNTRDGICMRGSAQATITDNVIRGNEGHGVALGERPCFDQDETFTGFVTGRDNTGGGNVMGDCCPQTLAFLFTEEGGELDRRE